MVDKIAVVTGSNKGIGFGTVRELCKRGVGVVYLTARDTQRGVKAVEDLKKEDLHVDFHQLDVQDKNSVERFAAHLMKKHSGIDILINNAGVICPNLKKSYEDDKYVINVNYRSYFNVMEYLFPLLKDNARVINVSSACGHITNLRNHFWIEKLTKNDITVQDINEFVDWYLNSVKDDCLNENDFITPLMLSYSISKVAICALTRIQQREIGRGISINSLHPGFVKTNMTANIGDLTVEEACDTPVYLALDCDQSLKGKFIWCDKSEVDWADKTFDFFPKNIEEINKIIKIMYEKKM